MDDRKYLILLHPTHNEVYFDASKKLSLTEMELGNNAMEKPWKGMCLETIENIDYIGFEAERLNENELFVLSKFSFIYALFEKCVKDDETLLKPVKLPQKKYFADDIVSILKYSGKTNEHFTRMMINAAAFAANLPTKDDLNILDPICGRGTTLYQSLIFGYNAYGVEIDKKQVEQASVFFTKYLETKRLKHKKSKSKISESGKKICDIYEYEFAMTKEDFKNDRNKKLKFVCGDTVNTDRYFKKDFFDLVIGDLPYGVQHGSSTKTGSFTRNPANLIKDALPSWMKVMKKGAVLALSWNTYVLKRDILKDILKDAHLEVLTGDYENFEHRVDQAIVRDVIFAKKI